MTWKPLQGIITPLVTPLLGHDIIDIESTKRLIDHVISGGVNGIFLLGSTGEGVSLSYETRKEFITLCCNYITDHYDKKIKISNSNNIPVLVSVTDTAFTETIQLAKFAQNAGATALVVSTPFYYSLGQLELLHYMDQLMKELPSDLPILLYNIPFLAKNTWMISTVRTLLQKYPNRIVGMKDSSGDMDYFHQLCQLKKEENLHSNFTVMIGPDHLLCEAIQMGGDGGVNGGSNIDPKVFVSLYQSVKEKIGDNDIDIKNRQDGQIQNLMKDISTLQEIYMVGSTIDNPFSRFIVGTKTALVCKGILTSSISNEPFESFDKRNTDKIQRILDRFSASKTA